MEKLKGLIIENDRSIPAELEAFQKDCADLFSEVKVISHARFYPDDVKDALREGYNAIIGLSTFMYKDQLENTVKLLESSPIKYQFYFYGVVHHLNEFIETVSGSPKQSYQFDNFQEFISSITKWVTEGRVNDIGSDYNVDMVNDAFHDFHHKRGQNACRFKLRTTKVLYNAKHKVFHLETDDLEEIQTINKDTHKSY